MPHSWRLVHAFDRTWVTDLLGHPAGRSQGPLFDLTSSGGGEAGGQVDGRLYGGHTKGDFEHSEVVLFLGKNPWQSTASRAVGPC